MDEQANGGVGNAAGKSERGRAEKWGGGEASLPNKPLECFGVCGVESSRQSLHVPARPDDWTHSIRLIVGASSTAGPVIVSRQISLSKPAGTRMTRRRASHFALELRRLEPKLKRQDGSRRARE